MSTPFEELINKYGLAGENAPTSLATGTPIPNVPQEFQGPIARASSKYGIPPERLAVSADIESTFNRQAIGGEPLPSGERAKGPWQFEPVTQKRMGLTDPFDIEQSADAAARLYKENLQAVGGNLDLASLAHFSGAKGAVGQLTPKAQAYLEQVRSRLPKFTTPSASAGEPDAFTSLVNKYGLSETQATTDLGIGKFPGLFPETPQQAIPTEEPIGVLGAVPKGIYSSFTRRLPEMVGQAGQFMGVPGAEGLTKWAKEGEVEPKFTGTLAEWLYKGGEMLAPSVAVPMAIGAAGLGGIPAAIGAGALYGLSQAQQTVETAKAAGKEAPTWTPWATGGIEALGETFGTIALQRLFGPLAPMVAKTGKITIGQALRPAFARTMKELFGVTLPTEIGTEIGQQVGEAAVEEAAGIRKPEYLKEAGSVIGPTAALTFMTLGLGRMAYRSQAKALEQAFTDPNTPENIRIQALSHLADTIGEVNRPVGEGLLSRGIQAIKNKESIPLDQDILEWAKTVPQAPGEARTGEPTTGQVGVGVGGEVPPTVTETPTGGEVQGPFAAPSKETPNNLVYSLRKPQEMNLNSFGERKRFDKWTAEELLSSNIPNRFNNPNDGPIFESLQGNPRKNIEPLAEEGMTITLSRDVKNNLVVQRIDFNKETWTKDRINEWYSKNKDRVDAISQGQVTKTGTLPVTAETPVSPKQAQPAPETTEEIYNKLLTYYKGDERALRGAQITPTILSEAKITTKPIEISSDLLLGKRGLKFINPNYVPAKKETVTTPPEVGKTEEEKWKDKTVKIAGVETKLGDLFGGKPIDHGKVVEIVEPEKGSKYYKVKYEDGFVSTTKEPPVIEEVPFGADLEKLSAEAEKQGLPEPKARIEEEEGPLQRFIAREAQRTPVSKEGIPEVEGLRYDGIQKTPEMPDQYQFTENSTGSTFYSTDLTPEHLIQERERIKQKFAKEGRGRIANQQPIWYNPLRTAIENRIPHEQPIKATNFALALKKEPGIKSDFVKWSGVEDFLNSKDKFTKQEVLDYLDAHVRTFEEVYYQEWPTPTPGANRQGFMGSPQFTQWQLPGPKTNEKEFFVTYPTSTKPKFGLRNKITNELWGIYESVDERDSEINKLQIPERWEKSIEYGASWVDGHAAYNSVDNPILRIRMNDRIDPDGKKVLMVEEMQPPNEENFPQMPKILQDNWYKIGIRRIIKYAAEQGYDAIAMTTGKQQAERYDLSKQISKVELEKNQIDEKLIIVRAYDKNNVNVLHLSIEPSKLKDYIGKEAAEKLLSKPWETDEYKIQNKSISGLDLKIGGEGLARLYDETLKNTFNDIGKKFLAKMEVRDIGIRSKPEKPITLIPMEEFPEAEAPLGTWIGQESIKKTEGKKEPVYVMALNDRLRNSVINKPIPMLRPATEYGLNPGVSLNQYAEIANGFHRIVGQAQGLELAYSLRRNPRDFEQSYRQAVKGNLDSPLPPSVELFGLTEWEETTTGDIRSLVTLALSANGKAVSFEDMTDTAMHEALHVAKELLLNRKENRMLDNAIPNEEDQANAFKDAVRKIKNPPKGLEAIFAKLEDFLKRIANFVRGMGFDSPDALFNRLYQGKYAPQEIETASPKTGLMPMPEGVQSWGEEARNNWHYGNPEALKQARIAEPPEVSTFEELRGQGYEKPFWAKLERFLLNPYGMTLRHPDGKSVWETELRGQQNNEERRKNYISDPDLVKGDANRIHQLFALPYKSAEKMLLVTDENGKKIWGPAIQSTIDNRVMERDELVNKYKLNDAEIEVYYAIKKTGDKVVKDILDTMEWTTYKYYEDKPWIKELKAVTKGIPEVDKDGNVRMDKLGRPILKRVDVLEVTRNMEEDETAEFVRAYRNVDRAMNKIEKARKQMGQVNYYFPLTHGEGEYVARVFKGTGKNEEIIDSVRATSEREAIKNMAMLKKKYKGQADIKFRAAIDKRKPESFFQSTSDVHIMKFVDEAVMKSRIKGEITEDQAASLVNSLVEELADELKSRGFGRHMISRLHPEQAEGKVVGGFKTENAQKIFWDYLVGAAGYLSKIPKSYEFYQALKDIDHTKAPERFEYWAKFIKDMLRNQQDVDKLSGHLRGIPYAYYLTMSLKPGVVQFGQNLVTGVPFLARHMKEMGVKGFAEKEYLKAFKDANIGNLNETEKEWLQKAIDEGETTDQFNQEAMGAVTNRFGAFYNKLFRYLGMPFSWMEIANRRGAFIAMFRTSQKAGLSPEESFQRGIDFIHETHYPIGKSNLPEWARGEGLGGALARAAYVFRSYNHNYIITMLHSMAKGPDGKRHFDVAARSLAYLALMGGTAAIPFLDDLLEEMEKITSTPYRAQMRTWLRGTGGQLLENFGMAGVPAAIGAMGIPGVDISGSLKIGIPKPNTENVYGVWGGLWTKGTDAYNSLMDENYSRMFEQAAPTGIENILKAWRLSKEPVTNKRGVIQFTEEGKPLELTGGEVTEQLLGFRPARASFLSKEKRIKSNIEQRFTDKRQHISNMIRLAKKQEDWDRIRDRIISYNKDAVEFQGAIPMITNESIKRSLTQVPEKKWMIFERMMGR